MKLHHLIGIVASAVLLGAAGPAASQTPPQPAFDNFSIDAEDVVGLTIEPDNSRWTAVDLESTVRRFASENSIKIARFTRSDEHYWDLYFAKTHRRAEIKPLFEHLKLLPGIKSVDLNVKVVVNSTPNDDHFSQQKELLDASRYGIKGESAWDIGGADRATAIMTVIDTGMVADPDVHGSTYTGWDFYANKSGATDPGTWTAPDRKECTDKNINQNSWHGLKMASLVAGITANDSGMASIGSWISKGISPKWVPIRVSGCNGSDTTKQADAIRWSIGEARAGAPAHTWKARVINISMSSAQPVTCPSNLQTAINAARTAGAVVVVSAGNVDNDATKYAPGNCQGTLVIAAHSTDDGRKLSSSNWGNNVALSAPGIVSVRSNDEKYGPATQGNYFTERVHGTSGATALVSVTLGRMFSANPQLTVDRAIAILKETVTPYELSCPGCGVGMLNAYGAIMASVVRVPYSVEMSPSWGNVRRGTCIYVYATVKDQYGQVLPDRDLIWKTSTNLAGYGGMGQPNRNYVCGNAVGPGEVTAQVVNYPGALGRANIGVAP